MSQTRSTSPPAVMLQDGLVSGLAWAFGVGLGAACVLGSYSATAFELVLC